MKKKNQKGRVVRNSDNIDDSKTKRGERPPNLQKRRKPRSVVFRRVWQMVDRVSANYQKCSASTVRASITFIKSAEQAFRGYYSKLDSLVRLRCILYDHLTSGYLK